MNENTTAFMGKKVRDVISGAEGIVIAIFHWITGCDTVLFEDPSEKTRSAELQRLEVVGDGCADRLDPKLFQHEQEYLRNLGRSGTDRISGYTGTVIGMCVNAFRASQYCLLAPAVDGKLAGSEIMDCARIDFADDAPAVEPESVQEKIGGGFAVPGNMTFI